MNGNGQHRYSSALWIAALALALPLQLAAQSSDEVNAAGLQFNLLNPGARSLGFGGAFNAAADDATAAYANPAGLLNLTQPEISFEGRGWRFANFYTDRGHVNGPPTMIGVDTSPGLVEGITTNHSLGLSFLSYVLPGESKPGETDPHPHWAVAFYRHELGAFRSSAHTQGAFFELGPPDDRVNNRFSPIAGSLSLDIDGWGTAFAYHPFKKLDVGVSATRYHFDFHSETNRYVAGSARTSPPPPGSFYGAPIEDPANLRNSQSQSGKDSAWALNAGALWKISRLFYVGAVYKRGTKYDMIVTSVEGPKGDPARPPIIIPTKFHVPTEYGVGVTMKTRSELTRVSIDCNRILYSELTKDLVTIDNFEAVGRHYHVADGTELHIGYEHIFVPEAKPSFIIRFGGWRDPDHRIVYSDPKDPLNPQSILFHPGRADRHLSAGFGIAFSKTTNLDIGVDRSRRQEIASISMVVHLPRP